MKKYYLYLIFSLLLSNVCFADDTVQNVQGTTFDVSTSQIKVEQGLTLQEIDTRIKNLQYESDTALAEIARLQTLENNAKAAGVISSIAVTPVNVAPQPDPGTQ